jgi:PAS domain S-box-containing protein
VKQGSLFAGIKLFFTPPAYPEDEEKTRRARLLHALLVGSILLMAVAILIAVPLFFVEKILNTILLSLVFGVMCLAYGLMRTGRLWLASILFIYGLWPFFTLFIFLTGGMLSVVATFYIVLVVVAGLLLGFRDALAYSIVCCLAGLGMILMELGGHPLPRLFPVPPFVGWLDLTVALFMTTLTVHFSLRELNSALTLTRRRLEEIQRTEKELRDSEERFSRMSSVAYEGIVIADQGRIIDANPQMAKMLGWDVKELIGLDPMECVAPESRDLVRANIRAEAEGPYEHKAIKKDGTFFPVAVRAKSIPYRGRQARVSVIRDITERKKTETDILRQMERLRALHTIERAITSSTNLQTILDLLAQEVVGQLHMDAASVLLFDETEQCLRFAAGKGFRTGALRFTNLNIGDGLAGRAAQTRKIMYIPDLAEIQDNPILTGSLTEEGFSAYFGVPLIAKGLLCGVMEIFRRSPFHVDPDWMTFLETLAGQAAIAIDNARLLDMTQAHLKETEALYRINRGLVASIDTLELMKEVVTLLQRDFGYFYVQIYVRDPATGDFVLRAGSGEIGAQLIGAGHRLAAGEGIVGYTAKTGEPFLTNNVNEVAFFRRNRLLPDTKSEMAVQIKIDGQFLGLLDVQQVPPFTLTLRDLQLVRTVADQLAVALQKVQLYADLQNSLLQEKSMHARLIQSEKLAVVGRLMASVSHELKNPLQAIHNALFLVRDEKSLSAQARKDLAIVLSEAERMEVILDRLRKAYQPVRKEDFHPLQINDIIHDVSALVASHLRHAHIAFSFHADPALPRVLGLGDQIRQVILNLFLNAEDAMPEGGQLAVSTETLPGAEEIQISVSDNGVGIDPALLPRIFEPFQSGKEKGTGLGLSISQEIIINHNGRIRADNRAEGGALFRIWLPIPKEGAA